MDAFVIAGNSAAGIAAAEAIRGVRRSDPVFIISPEKEPAYARCRINEVVESIAAPRDLIYRGEDFYRENGITCVGDTVSRIDPHEKIVSLGSGRTMRFGKLLVATGARPKIPLIEGMELEGIFSLRNMEDATILAKQVEHSRCAAVIGAGMVGLKAALALIGAGVPRVIVVEKDIHLLPGTLDHAAAVILQENLVNRGMEFVLGTEVIALSGGSENDSPGKSRVSTVLLSSGQKVSADLVVLAMGIMPNAELVTRAGGLVGKGVIVNEYLETTVPGVFAAGDVVELTDPQSGERIIPGLWPLAVEQGRVAGLNMAGYRRSYSPVICRMNAGEYGGLPIVSVGVVNPPPGSDYTVKIFWPGDKKRYRKLVYRDSVLVGALLVGDIFRAGRYTAMIRQGKPIGLRGSQPLWGRGVTGVWR
ncbi:MAG: NAD(P)/FAD-dependent oxidoreductase [Bacillota bacterium]